MKLDQSSLVVAILTEIGRQQCHGLLYDGEPGHLERLQTQVYLEPETGFAEDVFLWVAMGEQPAWVE